MPPPFLPVPRMLFRGDETCVVPDADALMARLETGWEARPLPGEDAAPARPPAPVSDDDPPKPKGRKARE